MGLFGKANSVLVVDTAAVLKTKGVRGGAAPRQQLQILRALSRFVQREKLQVTAVLVGAPLDKAPHNKVVEEVRVRYAASDAALDKELMSALKQAGSSGVLITENVELENRVIRSGGSTLRVSTFRKLLEDGNEPGENSNGGNNPNNSRPPRGGNNNRRDRDRGPRPNRGANSQQPKPQKPQSADAAGEAVEERRRNSSNDAISQMIDLVE
ncbi:MAG: hypothetical protein MUC65_10875 [Pontiellaceae bacterium]|jgi:hypothetical protein|nr:hypothetical protein [Pontiellaceae bacterium]